jgi:hypothetical protein
MLGCVRYLDTELVVYEAHVIALCSYTILYIAPPAVLPGKTLLHELYHRSDLQIP